MENPYNLTFGIRPEEVVPRLAQTYTVVNTFNAATPSQHVFILTGVRGSGKTVLMTDIVQRLQKQDRWITIELNPERDMLNALAAKLYSESALVSLFHAAHLDLSFFGFGIELRGEAPITDIEIALTRMIEVLKKENKRLLITVDEAVNSKEMRIFVSAFHILLRKDLPVYLLMTGLYENVSNLQNEKSLTFLYRAPKIQLDPLNIATIADNYRRNFQLDENSALRMARMTKGYSFAFQVLGYCTWEEGNLSEPVIQNYRQYLEEYVYEKIWSELSAKDRLIVHSIALSATGRIIEIRKSLGLSSNEFNPYRIRLIRKGLVHGDVHGYVYFTLPMFEQFVIANYDS